MNILFLSLINIHDINSPGIYNDLLRVFHRHGHEIFIISPNERRHKNSTTLIETDRVHYLNIWTLNYQKTNFIEKGLSTLLIEFQYRRGIDKFFPNVNFDIIIYPTPPITFGNVIREIKQRDNSFTYLLLKDIFPQNAVDLGLMSKRSIMYRFFRRKEKQLYRISDVIGCMSKANVEYILTNNEEILCQNVEVCPNSIEVSDYRSASLGEKNRIRESYGLPLNRQIYIYGGNLGKPQDIPFIINCLKNERNNNEAFFVIVGAGTDFKKIEQYINSEKPTNVKLLSHLAPKDYDELVRCCDVGLIFLDHRFTIPNYPSRLLSYLSAGIPVVAATDRNSDLGTMLEENRIGVWCESSDPRLFHDALNRIQKMEIPKERITKVLRDNFDVLLSYNTIMTRYEANCK